MLKLSNADLVVDLLDPAAPEDRVHQGLRFCWGGYIWQVHDRQAGPLLAGPEWPDPRPIPFNGQGLPESFRHATFGTGHPLIIQDGHGFIIGIGDVARNMAGNLDVAAPCSWSITPSPGTVGGSRCPSANVTCLGNRSVRYVPGKRGSSCTPK